MHRDFKGRGLEIVAVDLQESKSKVEAWVNKHNTTFRIVMDPDGVASKAYRITATPTVYIVGRDGKLVGSVIGTREWASPKGRALLEELTKP